MQIYTGLDLSRFSGGPPSSHPNGDTRVRVRLVVTGPLSRSSPIGLPTVGSTRRQSSLGSICEYSDASPSADRRWCRVER
jgi:hypothetical protein